MRLWMRNSINGAPRFRLAMLIFICTFFVLSVTPALAQGRRRRGKRGDAAAAAAPAAAPAARPQAAPGMGLSKTHALAALIQSLTLNKSAAARETLEQIVLGKMSFGKHNKQAAEAALA